MAVWLVLNVRMALTKVTVTYNPKIMSIWRVYWVTYFTIDV